MDTSFKRTQHLTVADFAEHIGLSVGRLYELWAEGKGPPREHRKATTWRGEKAVLIPLEGGLRWHAKRQARMTGRERLSGKKTQLRAVRERLIEAEAEAMAARLEARA